jgi:hypothetical protein
MEGVFEMTVGKCPVWERMSNLDQTCWGRFFWFVQVRSNEWRDFVTDVKRQGADRVGILVLWFIAIVDGVQMSVVAAVGCCVEVKTADGGGVGGDD